MPIIEIIKRYGNGHISVYRRSIGDTSSRNIPLRSREEENARLRVTKTRSNATQRCMSANFEYFVTFTTDNLELARDGKRLLHEAKEYLKAKNIKFFIQLETFRYKRDQFHVHGLTDQAVDFADWIEKFGTNRNSDNELGENYNNNSGHRNLYCCEILSDQSNCKKYITKDTDYTKQRMEQLYPGRRARIYASNVKKIKCDTEYNLYDDEELFLSDSDTDRNDTNETDNANVCTNNTVNRNDFCLSYAVSSDRRDVFGNSSCNDSCFSSDSSCDFKVEEEEKRKKTYLTVEARKQNIKSSKNGTISSNTKRYAPLIPWKKPKKTIAYRRIRFFDAVDLACRIKENVKINFLLAFIGYICHIPDERPYFGTKKTGLANDKIKKFV